MATIAEIRRDSHGFNGSGVFAKVTTQDGGTLLLSHLDREPAGQWVADGSFAANGFPRWCHGFGSRCTMLKVVSDSDLVTALEAAAAAL